MCRSSQGCTWTRICGRMLTHSRRFNEALCCHDEWKCLADSRAVEGRSFDICRWVVADFVFQFSWQWQDRFQPYVDSRRRLYKRDKDFTMAMNFFEPEKSIQKCQTHLNPPKQIERHHVALASGIHTWTILDLYNIQYYTQYVWFVLHLSTRCGFSVARAFGFTVDFYLMNFNKKFYK